MEDRFHRLPRMKWLEHSLLLGDSSLPPFDASPLQDIAIDRE